MKLESFSVERKDDPEDLAQEELDMLLSHPDNAFLIEHSMNLRRIEDAESAVVALQIVHELLDKRLEQTFQFKLLHPIEGVTVGEVEIEHIKEKIRSIKTNREQIGEGGDAFVVIDKSEVKEFPPEICYKFAIAERTPRGRNSMAYEAELQGDFFDIMKDMSGSRIGVPEPFFFTELGKDKVIAMEKLPARSVDDILRGLGSLPEWFNIDIFCDELRTFLDTAHNQGLYHRDMHVGNIMIRQLAEEPEDGKWGYVIDFGLSGYGNENMEPYKKEIAGNTFTYADDYVIIKKVRESLHAHQHLIGKE